MGVVSTDIIWNFGNSLRFCISVYNPTEIIIIAKSSTTPKSVAQSQVDVAADGLH